MKPAEKKLLEFYSQLTPEKRTTLLEFAEFLSKKGDSDYSSVEKIPEPVLRERPDEESVVGAIKRLTASYPMLDRDKLFNDTSNLMTRNVMKGEEANLIIDELEQLFQRFYQQLLDENSDALTGNND